MLAWRSCKRMFKSQRKCNINCNVGMNMLTLCEFLVFYSPFVVAFYGWTVVSCQLGFSWVSPCAVEGSCSMCNPQSQKLRAVHPCFASYVHDAVHLVWKSKLCIAVQLQNLNTSRHLKHQPQRVEGKQRVHIPLISADMRAKESRLQVGIPPRETMKSGEQGGKKMLQCNATLQICMKSVLQELTTCAMNKTPMSKWNSMCFISLPARKRSAWSDRPFQCQRCQRAPGEFKV